MQAFFTLEYFLKMTANFCIRTVFKNGKCKRPTCEQYLKKVEQLRPFHFNCSKALAFERVTTYSGAFISFFFKFFSKKTIVSCTIEPFQTFSRRHDMHCNDTQHNDKQHNKIQHLAFRHVMLSVTFVECHN